LFLRRVESQACFDLERQTVAALGWLEVEADAAVCLGVVDKSVGAQLTIVEALWLKI